MKCKLVAYFRRSRGTQALSFEAQQAAIDAHVAQSGCEVIAVYTETETGKKHDLTNRPELRKAIAHARRSNAVLLVAKLDRLLRSTVIANMLKTSGVKFVACDNPNANELTVDILAAVSANEVREISKRTKAALSALKARGVVLGAARPGAPQLTAEARQMGNAAAGKSIRANFVAAYSDLTDILAEMQCDGLSLRAMAARLNGLGQTTRRGKAWNPSQVQRVLSLVG
jgi:DNA invertase Pin-like site-specific DNA recombinase